MDKLLKNFRATLRLLFIDFELLNRTRQIFIGVQTPHIYAPRTPLCAGGGEKGYWVLSEASLEIASVDLSWKKNIHTVS